MYSSGRNVPIDNIGSSGTGNEEEENTTCWGKAVKFTEKVKVEPPILAVLAGIFVGSTPALRSLIIGDDAPLKWIANSIHQLGEPFITSMLLMLGANIIPRCTSSLVSVACPLSL